MVLTHVIASTHVKMVLTRVVTQSMVMVTFVSAKGRKPEVWGPRGPPGLVILDDKEIKWRGLMKNFV